MTVEIFNALHDLETELKAQGLWSDSKPSQQQLCSIEPFCVDTMPFEGWLQWIFIPKLTVLVGTPQFSGLSHPSDIFTMADYVFSQYEQSTDNITAVIARLDQLLNHYNT